MEYIKVLSIAGSDPSGGAGIQADMKTCCAMGCYAMTAITAITAQNTLGVRDFVPVSPEMLRAQIEAVCDDIRPDAIKIGMVPSSEAAGVIADMIEKYSLERIVVDPVMVSTSGHNLSEGSAIETLVRRVFPFASVITPNIPEANALGSDNPATLASMYNCPGVLVKGGHSAHHNNMVDLLWSDGSLHEFPVTYVDTPNTHGTGCTLSSAIACQLAMGKNVADACASAIQWLGVAIRSGANYKIGHGHGPVNHLFNII
ncbi:MAG: bifunctional hydroxymethylpyrimidine kinase/phosphomethylpyrimidine kinase [Muribaculaceae bacterium]|nr:bifunctional hydroxymethylpyrimidine kinase/phosphomethylpyrimidine kinase [Muribaculaceae bacterium]